ncbi:molybdate ABC transporter substrate-binding protein [Stappia sp. ES.058]|uniref:molybdate ABC transporter substrate-binding protein n=1 Tax=Stappia sp. ES.058 TaxID=1881061 RepID=UPI00087B673A|nr:molybdate ABC transporter substrate-binding protein [Stappia sp. ES.058]SDU01541.1 molybdenum ABC transporter, molybdate-binding protein [Stappia sp. ES.058]
MRLALATAFVLSLFTIPTMAETSVKLHAAGSLKAAMSDIADLYQETHGIPVDRMFGPSGLLRERIEGSEAAEVYASANMKHPTTLAKAGRSGPVALFARNQLCALTQANLTVEPETLLATMLDPQVRVGTSTPKADPAGDYAFQVFDKAQALSPGATETLKAKALQLTGGKDSAKAPEGRNPYGWVMESNGADLFLTYCTNAVLAQRDLPELRIVSLPDTLSVGANYGLTVMNDAPEAAWQLAFFILSPAGQEILSSYGFTVAGAL